MIRPIFKVRVLHGVCTHCRTFILSVRVGASDNDILERRIINHLYPLKEGPTEGPSPASTSPQGLFLQSVKLVGTRRRRDSALTSRLSASALEQLQSPSLSCSDRDLLLLCAALSSPAVTVRAAVQPAVLSGLAAAPSLPAVGVLRLLHVTGLARLRLPPGAWRAAQDRLATLSDSLSAADLAALSSASYRCAAAVSSRRLRARLLETAHRIAAGASDGDGSREVLPRLDSGAVLGGSSASNEMKSSSSSGSSSSSNNSNSRMEGTRELVAVLKALRLARVSSAPLLVALRRFVARRDERLPLAAAAHIAACFCSPPVRDDTALAVLEAVLERRLASSLSASRDAPPTPSAVSAPPDPSGSPSLPSQCAAPSSELPPAARDVSSSSAAADTAAPPPSRRSPEPACRPKDVARLLYAFSHLGHVPSERCLELVERHMAGWRLLPRPLPLVDALLSLAILGRYPEPLLRTVVTEEVAAHMAGSGRSRQLSRLALLRLAASLETSLRLPCLSSVLPPDALPRPDLASELRRRPRLAALLERLRRAAPAARAGLGYPVPHVNTASVLLTWPGGGRQAAELLDACAIVRTLGRGGHPPGTAEDSEGTAEDSEGTAEEPARAAENSEVRLEDPPRTAEDLEGTLEEPARAEVGREGRPGESEETRSVEGSVCAVGLVRLKARLARKLGFTVLWEVETSFQKADFPLAGRVNGHNIL